MRLNDKLPTILLPIETIARELNCNLVLATGLANRGYRVIVGHKEACEYTAIYSKSVMWVGKDAFKLKYPPSSKKHIADRALENNSPVVFIQDEGGIFPANEWTDLVLEKHRIEYIKLRQLGQVCVWGQRQKELLSLHGAAATNTLSVTGCPRLDLCLPRYDWLKYKSRENTKLQDNPYILMCTRFPSIAHFKGIEKFFISVSELALGERHDARFSTWRRDVHDLGDFVILVKEVAAAYPDMNIVLRPHPSEDIHFYRRIFLPFDNVIVNKHGSALDWIRPAKLIVHCNCTTGIEAVLAGKKVLNFLPNAVPRENYDKEVAREAGLSAISVTDAMEKIQLLLTQATPKAIWSDRSRSILNNIDEESMPLLLDQIESVAHDNGLDHSDLSLPRNRFMNKLVRRVIGVVDISATPRDPYLASKRGILDVNHIETVLDGCRSNGIGSASICDFGGNYVVIDPP
jgi:surface carbohydrate biosynthesis protein